MSTLTAVAHAPTVRRVAGLTRANVRLLLRNRLTMTYALVLPLLPLGLLVAGPGGEAAAASTGTVQSVLMLALLFPVYYNVLSQVVSRRDELVLKWLRTGEARDGEILLSIALPGTAIALVVAALAVVLGVAFGMPVPADLLLYGVGVLASCVAFAALGFWTAAWTRTAEAAQLTSTPVALLASLGVLATTLPGTLGDVAALTPTGALGRLTDTAWLGGTGGTWASTGEPLLVLAAWTALSLVLARRSMRWEPRA